MFRDQKKSNGLGSWEILTDIGEQGFFGIKGDYDETNESNGKNPVGGIGERVKEIDQKIESMDQVIRLETTDMSKYIQENFMGDTEVSANKGKSKNNLYLNSDIYFKGQSVIDSVKSMAMYPRRRRIYDIGVHKKNNSAEDAKEGIIILGTDENDLTLDESIKNEQQGTDRRKGKKNCDEIISNLLDVRITTPIIQQLETKGLIVKDTEAVEKSSKLLRSTHPSDADDVLKYYRMDDDKEENPPLYTYGNISVKISKENDTLLNEDIEPERANSGKTENISEDGKKELLEEALKDFQNSNVEIDNVKQYLFFGKSKKNKNEKQTEILQNYTLKAESTKQSIDHFNLVRNQDIKTLEDALVYFELFTDLQDLEGSLEQVRRHVKTKESHEEYFKTIDKEIQKLSFKYHPDRVRNRGGTEEEMETSQKLQTALNATRTVLNFLNAAFLEDINTDHKFGFYTKLNISSLSNEDEIKNRIYEVMFKIGVVSQIKQQNIISEIRKFLKDSKSCLHSYFLGNFDDFEKYRDSALFHLKCCTKGYKKLCREFEEVKQQCEFEKPDMISLIQRMANNSKRELKLLKQLKKIAKISLRGNYQFFSPDEEMDHYFVLPFVCYTNVMLMCNVMMKGATIFDRLPYIFHPFEPKYNDDLGFLMHLYYLTSYCTGNKQNDDIVMKIMGKFRLSEDGRRIKCQISKEEIELEFYKILLQTNEFLDYKFKVDNYVEAVTTNILMLDLKKCMTMMSEFQEKKQELSEDIKKFQKKTEERDEKYEKYDKIMQETEEFNKKLKERLENQRIKLSEKVSTDIPDEFKL